MSTRVLKMAAASRRKQNEENPSAFLERTAMDTRMDVQLSTSSKPGPDDSDDDETQSETESVISIDDTALTARSGGP